MLAFLGNLFSVNLFYGIDLIFGSVFVFIAVTYIGGLSTLLVAFVGGLYTWIFWDHPYAMVVVVTKRHSFTGFIAGWASHYCWRIVCSGSLSACRWLSSSTVRC